MAKSTSKQSSQQRGKSTQKKQKDALNQVKMEAASEVGVSLNEGGELSARQAGSVGGQMVKKMVQNYKKKK